MTLSHDLAVFQKNRSLRGPLPSGTAPYTCSDFYKSTAPGGKQKALHWDHRLSNERQNLQSSPLKDASRGGAQKALISLGTARPSPEHFPWESMTLQCLRHAAAAGQADAMSTISMKATKGESAYDLGIPMNYGYSAGSPQALRFVTEHVELIHNPPYEDWGCCLTCGTTSAIDIAFRILCNPGDTVLVEQHTYSGTMASAKLQGLKLLGIEMDDLGLVPEDLDQKLQNWDYARGTKPFVLYMIPTGQNPTGTTQSLRRRKAIYDIAERHDLYILEDDPYYFLQLGNAAPESTIQQRNDASAREEYMKSLTASYLSMDTSGRVLRMDTTSKILAPGLRCGWVTGCAQIIEKFVGYSEVGVLSPSGPSQVMVYKLLDESWGHEGFLDWLMSLSAQYRCRRDYFMKACRRYLPPNVCRWKVPEEGMFLWITMETSDLWEPRRIESPSHCLDIEDRIYTRAVDNGVLVSKGSWFTSEVEKIYDIHFRLTFAAAPFKELAGAVQRFANAVRSELSNRRIKMQENRQQP
ncbi:hypothetical protein Daus18300_009883 [Diaporthe australafricana]|uniref:Aminotransferase class I/classII large domain-containing protein n=1 Tax=Diaporthe australafricana TaxID=127596 RepID=A0ABR3WCK1_9PEZI